MWTLKRNVPTHQEAEIVSKSSAMVVPDEPADPIADSKALDRGLMAGHRQAFAAPSPTQVDAAQAMTRCSGVRT